MKKFTKTFIFSLAILGVISILSNGCKKSSDDSNNNPPVTTVTDKDGNVYHTVTIGTQVWMVENLKTTKYRNGDPIPNITDQYAWESLTSGGYCDYINDAINSTTYGRLYNWYAVVDSRNIAPTGWHVPTDAEWTILTIFLKGEDVAGSKLKEKGTTHWFGPNSDATNESGFTALPAGCRESVGFHLLNKNGIWSSTSVYDQHYVITRGVSYDNGSVNNSMGNKYSGFSVRCLRD